MASAETAHGVLQVSVTVVDTCSVATGEVLKAPAQASVKCPESTGYRLSLTPAPRERSQSGTASVAMVTDSTDAAPRQIMLLTISY